MARYQIYYENNVQSDCIKQTDTLEEAQQLIEDETKGKEYAGVGIPHDDRCHVFRYVVYDEMNFTEEDGLGDELISTDYYWEK